MRFTNQRYKTKQSLTKHLTEKKEFTFDHILEIHQITKIPVESIEKALMVLIDKSIIIKSDNTYIVVNF